MLSLTVNDQLIVEFQEARSTDLCQSALNQQESQHDKVIYQQEEE